MDNSCMVLFDEACEKKNNDALEQLIVKFMPYILRTSRILNYDCATTDLIIGLIETINRIREKGYIKFNNEGQAVNYVTKTICNIGRDLHRRKLNKIEEVHILSIYDLPNYVDLDYSLYECLYALPVKERKIIILRYLYGYSDAEIGNMLNKTRQSINKIRKNALLELKKEMEGDVDGNRIN